jgi:hypothetical protein
MSNRNQISYQITRMQHLECVQKIELVAQNKRAIKRIRMHSFVDRTLQTFAIYFLIATGFLGVAALGCWGFEIIDSNSSPTVLRGYNWQAQKNVCLGEVVVTLSGFLGSALVGACLSNRSEK